jgi:hypothetical protein
MENRLRISVMNPQPVFYEAIVVESETYGVNLYMAPSLLAPPWTVAP